jgi:predicted metalloprotease with PDZ domain
MRRPLMPASASAGRTRQRATRRGKLALRVVFAILSVLAGEAIASTAATAAPPAVAGPPLLLSVDARDVRRAVLHVALDVPLSGAGPVRLVFPKWVPGEHAPANPVVDLVMLAGTVDGRRVEWQRDPVDLFAFTFTTPPGATALSLRYDVLLAPGTATPQLALLDWNPALLYPSGSVIASTPVSASLLLPAGWSAATALDGPVRAGDRLTFAPVSVERLFDSPVLAGANLRVVPLTPTAELDVASDAPAPPVIDDAVKTHFTALVNEAQALFGAHHWRAPYHFLVTASDTISYTGLEHHESSWNGVDTDTLASSAAAKRYAGDLLCHEFTHSWNGKYRRPAGLVRADDQADETTDLLWVYEGLTEYYGDVFAARAGFWSPADYRAMLSAKYAYLDTEGGRATRSLADTTFQARLRAGRSAFSGARRAAEEYYDEGELMWLDADTLIRERTRGKRSLDDFARAFFGGTDGPPAVIPYTRADIVAALNAVLPYDWESFFHARLDLPTLHPPLDGIARSGFAISFVAKPAVVNPSTRVGGDSADRRFDLGARIAATGVVQDVATGGPAAASGMVPGMTIVGVDNRRFTPAGLTGAIERAAKSRAPIVLLVDNRQTFSTLNVVYAGGIKLPELRRDGTAHDYLADIVRPLTGSAK